MVAPLHPAPQRTKSSRPREIRLSGYYDATSTTPERDWGSYGGAVFEDLHFTRWQRSLAISRLRREIRNNPYLAGLVNKFPEAVGSSHLRSRTSSQAYNAAKELFWYRWSKRVTSAGDSLRTLEEIILRELLIAGEVFLVQLISGEVQVISSEFCGSAAPADGQGANGSEINGVRYNGWGKPTHYRFGQLNAFGQVDFSDAASTLVPARNVIHVYHKDRVLMGRGMPWLLPSVQTARDLYEITRSKTKQIKDVNHISGTLTKEHPTSGLMGMAYPSGYNPQVDNSSTPASIDDAADPVSTEPRRIELKNGQFIELEMGEKLDPLMSKYEAQDYKELTMIMLHAIATPVGLPVEMWFSGLGDVNYSGFKGLGVQWDARRKYVIRLLEDRFLDRLHFWRVSKAVNEGDLPPNPDQDDDLIDWAWRRTPVLDDDKQAGNIEKRIRAGIATVADFWEEEGYYAEEVFQRRRKLYLQALRAAGELAEGDEGTAVKVPLSFLLKNEVTQPTAPSTEPPAPPEQDDSTGDQSSDAASSNEAPATQHTRQQTQDAAA